MPVYQDGPRSPLFTPLNLEGEFAISEFGAAGGSNEMIAALKHAPSGECVGWGIPFDIKDVVVIRDKAVSVEMGSVTAQWLVFMHTSDLRMIENGRGQPISPMRGEGQLGEHAADYVVLYKDGVEERVQIRRRYQIGMFRHRWGESCFEAVSHRVHHPRLASHEQANADWGWSQTRIRAADLGYPDPWENWLYSWRNPFPDKPIAGVRFEPISGLIVLFAITAGDASSLPLRWRIRRKACLKLPQGEIFRHNLDEDGLLEQIQLDMGQVISATARLVYQNETWTDTHNNHIPQRSENEVLIEYTSHADAHFHLPSGQMIPVAQIEETHKSEHLQPVAQATQRVKLRVVDARNGECVPVKLHIHGEWGEYLVPIDRHRIINPEWFEDYSVDFSHLGIHSCTYIPGETTIDLPMGKIYLEISKGFEIEPIRKVIEITPEITEITIMLERVLPWRENGWVTADTHVHFLSPGSALLEGSAEGVNVINLLASQWGELMTNVGDFDGRTTWGSREAGGDGEYLVRVGTENRQHVLGHISLLGYKGNIIAPMTTGGPGESALGDPIEILLTEWARQCKKQGGLVVLPHFPDPRCENAASIVSGDIDAIEMTSWGNLYDGIDPYSLADWYRYLNCGYLVAAVGGTDKMSASMAVGTVRTYARISPNETFTYLTWMDAVRRAETFVTYGPLLEFTVDGQSMGSHIKMSSNGGTVDVIWQVASVTVPMSRVELIVNGEICEGVEVNSREGVGHWSVKVDKSSWLALLVRGHYPDKPEIIAAHSTPVMITIEGSPLLAATDAVTILEQIEGALAYLDTVGTRTEGEAYKRMRLVLTSTHRTLHNRMHQQGYYHDHAPMTNHSDHNLE